MYTTGMKFQNMFRRGLKILHKNFGNRLQSGFTLIELLIAIGLIAVLTGTLLMVFNPFGQIQKSQDAKRKSDLSTIQKSLELYYQDTGRYPPSTLDYKISSNATPVNWGSSWQPYLARVPADPVPTKTYIYFTPPAGNGQTYYLYASLDRVELDQQLCNSGNACTSMEAAGFPDANACGGVCNFGLTSPNVTP